MVWMRKENKSLWECSSSFSWNYTLSFINLIMPVCRCVLMRFMFSNVVYFMYNFVSIKSLHDTRLLCTIEMLPTWNDSRVGWTLQDLQSEKSKSFEDGWQIRLFSFWWSTWGCQLIDRLPKIRIRIIIK